MDEIVYTTGPRYIDGVNIDADIIAGHPAVVEKQVYESVNDGSLGTPQYALGSTNKDGSPF